MTLFLTADLHLGHEKVAEKRGFPSVQQHDEFVIEKWRSQVLPDDRVIVLGDISGGKTEDHALAVLSTLPGEKRLIAGNHDSVSAFSRRGHKMQEEFLKVFLSVESFSTMKMARREVLLSHYPYASQGDGPGRGPARYLQWRLPDMGALLIHGHTHHSDPFDGSMTGREMCVSWDAWGRLATEGDVAKWIERIEASLG